MSVFPETHVEVKKCVVVVATNENQTSSSGVTGFVVHAPLGVIFEFVAAFVDWFKRYAQVPFVGITGKAVAPAQLSFVGGGGGADTTCGPGTGGAGGTGGGGAGSASTGPAGTVNTGGGGGGSGGGPGSPGAAGGSGIVIIRGPASAGMSASPGTNIVTTLPAPAGGCKVATFTVSGTLTT
jgi:hypothetical protein